MEETIATKETIPKSKASLTDIMAGEQNQFIPRLDPYLPQELVGGYVPYVPGAEDEAVWNAASQACGTEKIHFVYVIDENRCWYLACPSSSLASNPDTWCPLAAALPGNSEYWDKETVYIYEQDGTASALRWDQDTGRMQVFLGASRTVLPKIQSIEGNFVTINPEMADEVRWQNKNLMTEKLSRAAARILLLAGIVANLIVAGIYAFQHISVNMMKRDLEIVQKETEEASNTLIKESYNAFQTGAINHMLRIQQLLDELARINGTLVKYSVDGDTVEWEILVPQSYQQGSGTIRGQVQPGIEKDGRVRIKGNR